MDDDSLGSRLKTLRGQKTQMEIAAQLGISSGNLGNYERNRNEPNRPLIRKFCDLFNVNVEWLMYGTGPQYKKATTAANDTADNDNLAAEATKKEILGAIKQENKKLVAEWAEKASEMSDLPTTMANLVHNGANLHDCLAMLNEKNDLNTKVLTAFYNSIIDIHTAVAQLVSERSEMLLIIKELKNGYAEAKSHIAQLQTQFAEMSDQQNASKKLTPNLDK